MAVNADKPTLWKADIARSVDFFNQWFMEFAPSTYRERRSEAAVRVARALEVTDQLSRLDADALRQHPETLPILRAATAPPIARDRLIGLASVKKSMVERMERAGKLPVRMSGAELDDQLQKLATLINRLLDRDIFPWLDQPEPPDAQMLARAATIVADRLCGAESDPIIRNEQERRQLASIARFLDERGYREATPAERSDLQQLRPGSYSFRYNVTVEQASGRTVRIPIDAVVARKRSDNPLPLLIEAKSAGDFTNTNKRRKEEAQKVAQLRATLGPNVSYILFLCGYFNPGYLGYEAAEGIDWVWEHRIADLEQFGV